MRHYGTSASWLYPGAHELLEYYEAGAKYHSGGGLTGGMFVSLFCPAIGGSPAAYMVLLLIGVICLVLITQRALFSDMQKKGSKAYQNARLEKARRKRKRQTAPGI